MKFKSFLLFIGFAFFLASCNPFSDDMEQQREKHVEIVEHQVRKGPGNIEKIQLFVEQHKIKEKETWLKKKFERLYRVGRFNGTVLIAQRGNVLYKGAYGYKNLLTKDSLSINTPFQLASVSKMFTATAIMILKERCALDYDVDIQNYLPGFPYEGITVRHLMNHRSGLSRYMSLAHDNWDFEVPLSNQDMLDLFIEHEPSTYFRPDRMFNYINTNYALLANIVEARSGKPFDEFVKEEIFDPLDMENSFIYNRWKLEEPENVAMGHHSWRKRPMKMTDDYLNGVMGDKGVFSSVTDLYKFDRALYSEKLIKAETLEDAFLPGTKRRRSDSYGFGWRIKTQMPGVVYHFGWWRGYKTCFIRDLENEIVILVLNNRVRSPSSVHYWEVLDYLRGFKVESFPEIEPVKDNQNAPLSSR